MYTIKFNRGSEGGGIFFKWKRVYGPGFWTPFVKIKKRYPTWFGCFKAEPYDQQNGSS